MAKSSENELVFVPLGGVGEIGMNMAAYGFGPAHKRRWVVVDCGVTFAGPDLPGIDLIMPDPTFLEDIIDDIEALIVTHSHEDHYGAVLDVWSGFDLPVYATAFTLAMIKAKKAGNGYTVDLDLREMHVGKPFTLGPFTIEAINMVHSIPESCALLIETEIGRALHTGDWKLDDNPVSGPPTDVKRLQKVGKADTPLALICDSTNATKEGESPSEREIGAQLEEIIKGAKYRVAVTTFASNVGRIISVARAAQRAGREVVLSGRSMHRITTIAREMGMLDDLPPFHDQDAFQSLPRDKVVLLCTGSQGESRAAIARIANGSHPMIDLTAGDTMIFSSWAIPGNEREVIDIQNKLIDNGIELITNKDALVHVTGHPRRGEMRQLYDWVKPAVLIPVHGEAVHLKAHAALGREAGIADVVEARNGDMVRLFPNPMAYPAEVVSGVLYLDGDVLCTPQESGVKGRRKLGFGGMIAVSLCLGRNGEITSGPDISIDGIPELEDDDSIESLVVGTIRGVLRSMPNKRRNDPQAAGESMRRAIRSEINAYWGRKPNVVVFAHKG